jgi:hypothetical protein
MGHCDVLFGGGPPVNHSQASNDWKIDWVIESAQHRSRRAPQVRSRATDPSFPADADVLGRRARGLQVRPPEKAMGERVPLR